MNNATAIYGGTGSEWLLADSRTFSSDAPGDTTSVYIQAGSGAQSIVGGHGTDTLVGGSDTLTSVTVTFDPGTGPYDESAPYTLAGAQGFDWITGGGGDDLIEAGTGSALIDGGTGGDEGSNTLNGLGGNDALIGGKKNDTLLGGAGDDYLVGGEGADSIDGGAGNDVLIGGSAALPEDNAPDTLVGGAGADVYIVGEGDAIVDSDHNGTIKDTQGNLLGNLQLISFGDGLYVDVASNVVMTVDALGSAHVVVGTAGGTGSANTKALADSGAFQTLDSGSGGPLSFMIDNFTEARGQGLGLASYGEVGVCSG